MLDKLIEIEEQPRTGEDEEWDAFVADHPQGSLLQTTAWARLKNRFGWRSQRIWLRRDGKLVAGAQMLIRPAALGLMRIAYIPHGPLVEWENQEQLGILFNQIDLAAYQQGAGMLKIEPLIWTDDLSLTEWESLCQREGCLTDTDTIQPPRTIIVDLSDSEEAILAGMKQKTRYNIRLASKKGVVVRQGSEADLPGFNRMIYETGRRNAFGVHKAGYYDAAYKLFSPDQRALLIAEYDGRPLSAVMVFKSGKRAAYLYGASSDEERNRMPNYAVQWEAMRWARKQGCLEYDLWGVPDMEQDQLDANFKGRADGLWGVYRFKRGFGGRVRRTVGSADRVYNKLVYRLYRWRQSR